MKEPSTKDSNPVLDPVNSACVAGSSAVPYRLAIIGSGPAGTALVARAIQLGFTKELFSNITLSKGNEAQDLQINAGICMFDRDNEYRFGGGRLQDYKINSNTYGGKFVTNLTEDRSDHLPPERASGTCLQDLGKSEIGKVLQDHDTSIAPLDIIGSFLLELGQAIRDTVRAFPESSACHCDTEVTRIQLMPDSKLWKITALNLCTKTMFETYAVAVVLASGGRQELPRLHSSPLNKKVMTSDIICTQAGIDEIQERLKKVQQKKIVIIGGSHSAFSAAWICLNKLGWPKHAMSAGDVPNSPGPSATSQAHSIYIIHRTPIKVYYATKREAERDNYSGNEANKQGQIHPFSGLRGDAKQLFNNIRTGAETRVRLLATGADGAAHQTMYNRLCQEASVIIWACGYGASTPYDIVNEDNECIRLHRVRGQVELDEVARVLRAPSLGTSGPPTPVPNMFATGLGFGLNVSGDTQGESSSKADGVEVYLRRASTVILSHVLGTKVFGDGCKSWDEHCAENWRRILAAQKRKRALEKGLNPDAEGGESDPESSCSKVFASPAGRSRTVASSSKVVRPLATSPIPRSPVRRIARTAEPRTRRLRGVCNVESPAKGGGGKKMVPNIPPSPIRKISTAKLPSRGDESARGRSYRSSSSAHVVTRPPPLSPDSHLVKDSPSYDSADSRESTGNIDPTRQDVLAPLVLEIPACGDKDVQDVGSSPIRSRSVVGSDTADLSQTPLTENDSAYESCFQSSSGFRDHNNDDVISQPIPVKPVESSPSATVAEKQWAREVRTAIQPVCFELSGIDNCTTESIVGIDKRLLISSKGENKEIKKSSADDKEDFVLVLTAQPHHPLSPFKDDRAVRGEKENKQTLKVSPPSPIKCISPRYDAFKLPQKITTLMSASLPTKSTLAAGDTPHPENLVNSDTDKNLAAKFRLSVPTSSRTSGSSSALAVNGKNTLPAISGGCTVAHTPTTLKNVKKLLFAKSTTLSVPQRMHMAKKR